MKRVWLLTITYTLLLCLPLSLFFWLLLMILFPHALIGVSLFSMLGVSLLVVAAAGWRMFHWLKVRLLLRYYTAQYKLTPKILAEALHEPLNNFSYGNRGRIVYRLGGAAYDRQFLAALVAHYGPLDGYADQPID